MSGAKTRKNVPMQPSTRALEERWGSALTHRGWTAVPNLLLEYQGRLQLKDQEVILLMHIMKFWWEKDKLPYPSVKTLAKQLGKDERSVRRSLKRLEEHPYPQEAWGYTPGYLWREKRDKADGGRDSNAFNLVPLKRALKALVDEEVAAREAKQKRQPSIPSSPKPRIRLSHAKN